MRLSTWSRSSRRTNRQIAAEADPAATVVIQVEETVAEEAEVVGVEEAEDVAVLESCNGKSRQAKGGVIQLDLYPRIVSSDSYYVYESFRAMEIMRSRYQESAPLVVFAHRARPICDEDSQAREAVPLSTHEDQVEQLQRIF